ncbi:MAG: acyl-CoA/acyl-ACP dehydrogenase [Gammaproteobacteria bacterium]|nr:acyl-CoA/acyl-ACP dehydrogenase [Gammaproteobacteria bacterium]MDE0453351.1 acyl-CoA/acyl-ACP dehydrogenase [Gammaproteobacteria bacterium]
MNFEFSDEQNLLREQAAGFLADKCPPGAVRAVLEGDASFDAELFKGIADMGWTAATIPEKHGGLGLSYLELCVIAEELGRVVAPVPFSSSVYLATEALLLAGSDAQRQAWLPKLATGAAIGTFALTESAGQASPDRLATSCDNGSLTGSKLPVADGDTADFAVVVAKCDSGDGASLCLVPLQADGVKRTAVATLDPTRSHARIDFDHAAAEPLGADGEGWELTRRILDRAAVLFAWEQVGGANAALEQAKEYAMGRYAFGRPIAGFQAIKHKLANMFVKNTLARSNCYYGAWALSTDASELPLAAATARVSAIQAYYFASKENIQTHGGMGFTWEFDCQFHYRRAKLLSVNIGSERTWQDRLISAVEAGQAA